MSVYDAWLGLLSVRSIYIRKYVFSILYVHILRTARIHYASCYAYMYLGFNNAVHRIAYREEAQKMQLLES